MVADEVRSLAGKSAEAAKQTADLITRSVTSVAEGERLADETAKVLQEVAEKAVLVEKAIKEIEESSFYQVQAIEQINQGLSQVSSVVQIKRCHRRRKLLFQRRTGRPGADASTGSEQIPAFKVRL